MKSALMGRFLAPSTGKISDRIRAYGHGRICQEPGCDTLLSTYNPALYCSLHEAVGVLQPRR